MSNVLFNRETMKVVGVDRERLPYELEVESVDVTKLSKTQKDTIQSVECNEDQEELYLLPTGDKVTINDERWSEELEVSLVDSPVYTVIKFDDRPADFTYDDIVAHKEKQQVEGTLYTTAKLYEYMDESLFSVDINTHNAHIGVDQVVLPVGGQVRTKKLPLNTAKTIVAIKYEADVNLDVYVGSTVDTIQQVDKYNERIFASPVDEVYVLFKNNTEKEVELKSFTILT